MFILNVQLLNKIYYFLIFSYRKLFCVFSASPPLSSVGISSGSVRESPILLNEIRALQQALRHERAEKARFEVDYYKKQLQSLKPLSVS